MKKFWVYGLVVILIIIAIWAVVWGPKTYQKYQQRYIAQNILASIKTIEDSYKNDPYGGATPEETLQGFITALKAGDVNSAANYFVPEKRGEYKKTIQSWKDGGKLEQVIDYFSYKQIPKVLNNTAAVITFADKSDNAVLMLEFFKNKSTGKWLIESL